MGLINCEVTRSFNSPKKVDGQVIYKEFKLGAKVKGELLNDSSRMQMFQTTDGFVIPKSNLKPLINNGNSDENLDYAEIVEEKSKTFNSPLKYNSKIASILKEKNKTAINGAIFGLVVGFAYALSKDKSKVLFSMVGSVGGFILGNLYNSYIKDDSK